MCRSPSSPTCCRWRRPARSTLKTRSRSCNRASPQPRMSANATRASLNAPAAGQRLELYKPAAAVGDLERQIPGEIAWVLRVDGHTDTRPISSAQFRSNWELSSARAISVVQYLIGRGISPQRLVAAGFGEFQPIDTATTDEAYRRNRRIELKLTER